MLVVSRRKKKFKSLASRVKSLLTAFNRCLLLLLFFLFLGNRGLILDGIISNFLRSIPVPVLSFIWESFFPGGLGGGVTV